MSYYKNENIYNKKLAYLTELNKYLLCGKGVKKQMTLSRFVKPRRLIITGILLFSLLFVLNSVSADPVVNSITTNPANPKPESTLTVIVDVSGEDISKVVLTASECSTVCYENPVLNQEMTLNAQGKYELEFTLIDSKDRTDHIEYQLVITDNGEEYVLQEDSWKTSLDISSGSTDNSENNNDSNDSPGFELAIVFIAAIIGIAIYKKKR